MQQQTMDIVYHGIDITPKMVELASSRFQTAKFEVGTIPQTEQKEAYDYVFASGIFYLVEDEPLLNMEQTIREMFARCKKGIAFNSLSSWAAQQTPGEFYASPADTIDFCKTLSPYVVLRHDYHLADFTVYIYKENPNL
jgi:hypothetical protein